MLPNLLRALTSAAGRPARPRLILSLFVVVLPGRHLGFCYYVGGEPSRGVECAEPFVIIEAGRPRNSTPNGTPKVAIIYIRTFRNTRPGTRLPGSREARLGMTGRRKSISPPREKGTEQID